MDTPDPAIPRLELRVIPADPEAPDKTLELAAQLRWLTGLAPDTAAGGDATESGFEKPFEALRAESTLLHRAEQSSMANQPQVEAVAVRLATPGGADEQLGLAEATRRDLLKKLRETLALTQGFEVRAEAIEAEVRSADSPA